MSNAGRRMPAFGFQNADLRTVTPYSTFHILHISHLPVRPRVRLTQADRTYLRNLQINRSS